jgi:predicted phosphodiesterase
MFVNKFFYLCGMKINILHFSDFHYQDEFADDCARIGKLMAESTKDTPLDVIIFSGDMVQGVEESFADAYRTLLKPIVEKHRIPMSQVLIVPGNHDVDKTVVHNTIESLGQCNSEEKLDAFCSDPQLMKSSLSRMVPFDTFCQELYDRKECNSFGTCSTFELNGVSVGLVGLNSSWSCIDSSRDRGQLLYPVEEAEKLFNQVQHCDIVFASMHHYVGDFKFFVAQKMEEVLQNGCNILFTGHYHRQQLNASLSPKGCLLHNVAPAAFVRNTVWSQYGYSILTVDTDSFEVESSIFHFMDGEFMMKKKLRTSVMMSDQKRRAKELRKTLQILRRFINSIANNFFLTHSQQTQGADYDALSARPIIMRRVSGSTAEESRHKLVRLSQLEDSTQSFLITGDKGSGKTPLLFRIWIDVLRDYDRKNVIPIYIDNSRYLTRSLDLVWELELLLGQSQSEILQTFQQKELLLLVDDFTLSNNNLINAVKKVLPHFPHIRVIACTRELFTNDDDTLSINGKKVKYLTFFGFEKP